ncbi:hypothetical protein G9A89_019667 [Geosiphon pyriformis]|nr:hypothetical protein G9A89_019667 [Geosiphon pyriformis]
MRGEFLQKIGSAVLTASNFTPAVAITGSLTVVGVAASATTEIIGHATDDDVKKVGKWFQEFTVGVAVDGLSAGTLNSGAPMIAKATKKICKGISELEDIKDI